jgi:CRP-like cAMP-binding protein
MSGTANRTLRKVAIFNQLNGDALAHWEAHCQWKTVRAKERIVEIDDPSRDVFFLIEGRAHVIIYSVGGQVVLFRDVEAGGMFGEFAAIDNKRRSACVEATEPCLVACITAGNFRKLLRRDNAVMLALLEHAIEQVRALTNRVFEFSTLAVKNRIHVELLRLAQEGEAKGKEVRISPFPRHLDIASRISTHREAVTRELTRLTRLDVIRREGSAIVIQDPARLTRMVREVDGR